MPRWSLDRLDFRTIVGATLGFVVLAAVISFALVR